MLVTFKPDLPSGKSSLRAGLSRSRSGPFLDKLSLIVQTGMPQWQINCISLMWSMWVERLCIHLGFSYINGGLLGSSSWDWTLWCSFIIKYIVRLVVTMASSLGRCKMVSYSFFGKHFLRSYFQSSVLNFVLKSVQ